MYRRNLWHETSSPDVLATDAKGEDGSDILAPVSSGNFGLVQVSVECTPEGFSSRIEGPVAYEDVYTLEDKTKLKPCPRARGRSGVRLSYVVARTAPGLFTIALLRPLVISYSRPFLGYRVL